VTAAPSERCRTDLLAQLALAAIVFGAALPPIVAGDLGPKAFDHRFFHLPLVRAWSESWPMVDLRDYGSATGPLYHWIMAGIAKAIGSGDALETSARLQLVSACFGAGAAVVLFRAVRRTLDAPAAFLAGATLACSPYLLGNAIWMMTDNLSLLFIAAVVGSAAFAPQRDGRILGEGALAALATATRQINPWLIAPIVAGALLRGEGLRHHLRATALACAMPAAVLAGFLALWGGLVPPRFRELHAAGANPAAIGFALLLVAAYGWPMLLACGDASRRLLRRPGLLAVVALVGCALAAIGPSFASLEAGRNGGWVWRIVAALPTIADRSPLIVLGGAAGAIMLAILLAQARLAGRAGESLVVLASFAGFAAAHAANSQVFQRYYDPMVLATLAWLAACTRSRGDEPARATRRRRIALAIVAAMQAGFALAVL
jgi:4-amino-4-deoxy-L-arabinose transferase-like glycosyltransferase